MDYSLIIAYLRNQCNNAEKKEVEHWKHENPDEFNRLKYVWEKSGIVPSENSNREKVWNKINPDTSATEKTGKKKIAILASRIQRIAALIILLLCIGFVLYYQFINIETLEIAWTETQNDAMMAQKLAMPDGSVIWLNAASKIRYSTEFNTRKREIFLEGEAYFEVAHNKKKPFIIHTGNTITRVLGTSFNVMENLSGNIQVTVVNGRVSFSDATNPDASVMLTKNETGLFTEQSHRVIKQVNENMNFLAWKTGILSFSKTPLDEVCKTLSKHYNIPVKIADESIKQLNLTANYDHKKLEEVLEIMQLTLDIQHTRNDSCIVLQSRN